MGLASLHGPVTSSHPRRPAPPTTAARPRGPCTATQNRPWRWSTGQVWHVFISLSHLQTQAALFRKGRLRPPGRKAGLVGTAHSWALGSFQLGHCPVSQGPSWSDGIWWPWLAPRCMGDALLEAASVQGFIAGEPRYPT